MKNGLLLIFILFCASILSAQNATTSGKITHYKQFATKLITPRNVSVWVPENYPKAGKYNVVYMHDGQMLYDATTTWNKQEWNADEVAQALNSNNQTLPFIIVGIDNVSQQRYEDYLPQGALKYLSTNDKAKVNIKPSADNYLKFITQELKPFIDKNYSTLTEAQNTYIMGSSMGGLISLYALCEYPNVFGGAACISTHTPMVLARENHTITADAMSQAFVKYLNDKLPKTNSKKIYMDRGDQGLDSSYPKYQDALDKAMQDKGWNEPMWVSRVFPNKGHSETDWASRLRTPFQFLLSNEKKETITRVDPLFWWSGMKNSSLQLMIYGDNIATYTPFINYQGIEIKSINKLESPNYIIMYLDIKDAKAGQFNITLTKGKKKLVHSYELKERKPRTVAHEGFNSSDVIYLVMPDRFANGDTSNDVVKMKRPYNLDRSHLGERHGGDLKGIMNKLDYIDELGATTIWLNPVLENDMGAFSYHGYAATDYYKVDPRYGSNQDYVTLTDSLHARGMKMVMDMVFNHCGSYHPWNLDRPTGDWFNSTNNYVQTNHNKTAFFDPYCSKVDMKTMIDGWFVPTMPDFNQRNKMVADYLIQNSIWWIEYVGLNGIRQDTYPYPDYEMMQRWCREVMAEYPDFNIVGEAWLSSSVGAAFWQKGNKLNPKDTELKSVMDFPLQEISTAAFSEETNWGSGLVKIFEHMAYDFLYPDINNVLRFYENHDTDRFLKEPAKDLNAYRQAMLFLATIPGIPQIYYGQEILMSGTTKIGGYENIRRDMPGGWNEDSETVFTEDGRTKMQNDAYNFTSKLLQWRKNNEIVAKGSMTHFIPINGVYVYAREYKGNKFIVVMNGITKENEINWEHYKELTTKLSGIDMLTGKTIKFSGKQSLQDREILLIEM